MGELDLEKPAGLFLKTKKVAKEKDTIVFYAPIAYRHKIQKALDVWKSMGDGEMSKNVCRAILDRRKTEQAIEDGTYIPRLDEEFFNAVAIAIENKKFTIDQITRMRDNARQFAKMFDYCLKANTLAKGSVG